MTNAGKRLQLKTDEMGFYWYNTLLKMRTQSFFSGEMAEAARKARLTIWHSPQEPVKLLDCPFCGGAGDYACQSSCFYAVNCTNCGARGPGFRFPGYTSKKYWQLRFKWKVCQAWNKRILPLAKEATP